MSKADSPDLRDRRDLTSVVYRRAWRRGTKCRREWSEGSEIQPSTEMALCSCIEYEIGELSMMMTLDKSVSTLVKSLI